MDTSDGKISRNTIHEDSGSLRDLLATLQSQLPAASIMTPWSQVQKVQAESNGRETKARARALMDQNQFSAIPMVWSDRVIGVYARRDPMRDPGYEALRPEHFVESNIALIDLIHHMRDCDKVVVGVGSADRPAGWLTYADLSKRPFRVLLFAIMAEVEYLVARSLDVAYPDDSWIELLGGDDSVRNDQASLRRSKEDALHWDVKMPMTTFANIGQLTHALAASSRALAILGESDQIADSLRSISELRNRVAHAVKPVVDGPGQIKGVADQIDLMLRWITSWTASLAAAAPGLVAKPSPATNGELLAAAQ
jgi:hypothetical protein